MFAIRAADSGDLKEMAELVKARATWMRSRGVPDWTGWHAYADHVALPAWLITDQEGALVGPYLPVSDVGGRAVWKRRMRADPVDQPVMYAPALRAIPTGKADFSLGDLSCRT